MHARFVSRITVGVLLVAAFGGFSASARAQPATNVATDWNAIASTAIMPTAGSRRTPRRLSLAMVQGAVYDAVNAIDGGHEPYLVAPAAEPSDSKEAAAATAAFRVLVGLFPAQQAALQPLYDASLAGVPAGPAKAGGIAVGEEAAAAMLAAQDERRPRGAVQLRLRAPIRVSGGRRRPTSGIDPAPWVGNVRPFLVPDVGDAPHRRAERAHEHTPTRRTSTR